MIFDDLQLQYALLLTIALLVGTAGLAIARMKREVTVLRATTADIVRLLKESRQPVDADLKRLFDRHLGVLEHYLSQAPAEPVHNEPPVAAVREAASIAAPTASDPVSLAKSGATVDDLVAACGLNRGEAQLLTRLHAGNDAPAAH